MGLFLYKSSEPNWWSQETSDYHFSFHFFSNNFVIRQSSIYITKTESLSRTQLSAGFGIQYHKY